LDWTDLRCAGLQSRALDAASTTKHAAACANDSLRPDCEEGGLFATIFTSSEDTALALGGTGVHIFPKLA